MYSQFSYAQQTGTAQTQGLIQQSGVTWNGREWVPSTSLPYVTTPPPPSNIQLPPCPPHLQMPDLLRTPVATLVTHFSLAYQYFAEQMKNAEVEATRTTGAEKEEAERQVAWHKYHADLSARCAHHYNNFQTSSASNTMMTSSAGTVSSATLSSSNGISSINSNSPPIVTSSSNEPSFTKTVLKSIKSISSSTQKDTVKSSSSSSHLPPASFQRFAHRCLSKCENDIQRSSMEKQIASTIEISIKEGYMHSKNWDIEPELAIKLDMKAFLGRKITSEPSSTISASTKSKAKVSHLSKDLPESFRRYMQRCLAQCDNDIQRVSMEQQLLKRMDQAVSEGSMNSRNWDEEPELNIKLDIKAFLTKKISSASMKANNIEEFSQGIKVKPIATRGLSNPLVISKEKTVSIPPFPTRAKSDSEVLVADKEMSSNFRFKEMKQLNDESMKLKRKRSDYDSDIDKVTKNDHDDVDSYYGPVIESTKKAAVSLNDSYYGPSSARNSSYTDTVTKSRMLSDAYNEGLPQNESYYGNSSNRPVFQSSVSKTNFSDDMVTTDSKIVFRPNRLPGTYVSLDEDSKPDRYADHQIFEEYIPLPSKLPSRTVSSKLEQNNPSSKAEKVSPGKSFDKLSHRANRFSGKGGITEAVSSELHSEYISGTDKYMGKSFIGGINGLSNKSKLDEQDYEKMTVKGTCQTLEKDYLRLTAPPRAELVRPQPVLEAHLKNLMKRWYQQNSEAVLSNKNIKGKDYAWYCSQLKAIRQDLTVQRITNEFTVDCYENHARIALEEGDLNEYNQCQTKLKEMYDILRHGVSPLTNTNKISFSTLQQRGLQNESEFIAYRIIYYCFLTGNKKYDGGSSDLMKILKSLTTEQRSNTFIAHAIHVREAVASDDYHSFFSLEITCPNQGIFLMAMIAPQMRSVGLQRIVKAYRPNVPMAFVCKELSLGSIDEGMVWLKSCGCKFTDDKASIITKDTELKESELCGKKSSSLI